MKFLLARRANPSLRLISSTPAQSINVVQAADGHVHTLGAPVKSNVQSSVTRYHFAFAMWGCGLQLRSMQFKRAPRITIRRRGLHLDIRDALSTGLGQNKELAAGLRQRVATSYQVDQLSQRVHHSSLQARGASHKQAQETAGRVDELKHILKASSLLNPDQRSATGET